MGQFGDAAGVYSPPVVPDMSGDGYGDVAMAGEAADLLTPPPPPPRLPFKSVTSTFNEDGTREDTFKGVDHGFSQKLQQNAEIGSQVSRIAPAIESALQNSQAEIGRLRSELARQRGVVGLQASEAQGAFGDAINGLRAKRDLLTSHPILAGVGRIASTAAAEYAGGPGARRISPLVHAAGAYGLDTFGQSPDNLNTQIAGLSTQAEAAQLPYANLLQQGLNNEEANASRAETRAQLSFENDRKDKETAQKNRDTALNRFDATTETGARAGVFNRPRYIEGKIRLGESPAQANAAADAYEKIAKNVTDDRKEARRQVQEGKIEIENLKYRQRASLVQQRYANSISPSKEAFDQREARFKAELHNAMAGDKELSVVGNKDKDALRSSAQTEMYLDKVTGGLNRPELKGLAGPPFAIFKDTKGEFHVTVNEQAILPRFAKSADRIEMEALFQHEIPRILSTVMNIQGGASILRSEQGRQLVAKLGAALNQRPDQILAVMGTIRDTVNDTRSAITRSHPKVGWETDYRDLLGLDNPNNARYYGARKDSLGGTIFGPAIAGGKPAPALPADVAIPKGKFYKDELGNYWDSDRKLVRSANR